MPLSLPVLLARVDALTVAQALEAVMLFCFGISWPIAIWRTWRTRRTEGLSPVFLTMILAGYLAGVGSKLLRSGGRWDALEWVTALYALNAALVGIELMLYLRFRPPRG
jgi:uncharacterized membrane protein